MLLCSNSSVLSRAVFPVHGCIGKRLQKSHAEVLHKKAPLANSHLALAGRMSLELWIACVLITDQRVSIFAKAAGHGEPCTIGEDCIAL